LKIAVSTDGHDLDSRVEHRFGTSRYLMIIDTETMAFEVVPNPGIVRQGGGMQAVAVAIDRKVDTVLTGYCSPTGEDYLSANNIKLLTGVEGTVREVIERYQDGDYDYPRPGVTDGRISRDKIVHALKRSGEQFYKIMPIIMGVILLIGLFQVFVTKEFVSSVFTGNRAWDTFFGACFGTLVAGNPVNSYIIGGELLKFGVGLFGVTAFILAWVNVGLIQLPAESAALGWKFALVRNGLSFVLSMLIATLTVGILFFIKG
jgi:predicted Fe-Mo cluster-binding NifX family protein